MFRDDVDRLFADLFPGGRHGASNEARAPVDVYLTDGPPPSLTVEIDIAGVNPAQVDVGLVEDVLVVRGERRRAGDGRRVYQHAEIAWGPFERRLRLGVAVDAAAATASYESGILRILLPLAPSPPLRRVRHRRPRGAPDGRGGRPEVEIAGTEEPPEAETAIPAALPVLPLKETVVFPEAVAPLADRASRGRCA